MPVGLRDNRDLRSLPSAAGTTRKPPVRALYGLAGLRDGSGHGSDPCIAPVGRCDAKAVTLP